MENNKVILKTENLSVSYGVVKALIDIEFEVENGEFVAVIGPNNAGKSTLLGTILGLNKIDNGVVTFEGRNITKTSTDAIVSSGISLVPERRCLLSSMSVLENLKLGAYHKTKNFKDNLSMVFEFFPIIKERINQISGTLSGGEQQMLAIARALMAEPKVIMFDEPSLGLSPIIVQEVFDNICNLNKQGKTVVLSEQNAHKALQISQKCYVIEKGRVIMKGLSRDLIDNENIRNAYLGGGIE